MRWPWLMALRVDSIPTMVEGASLATLLHDSWRVPLYLSYMCLRKGQRLPVNYLYYFHVYAGKCWALQEPLRQHLGGRGGCSCSRAAPQRLLHRPLRQALTRLEQVCCSLRDSAKHPFAWCYVSCGKKCTSDTV